MTFAVQISVKELAAIFSPFLVDVIKIPCEFAHDLSALVSFFSLMCVFALYLRSADGVCVFVCALPDTPKGEVGRVTEETPFVFGVWMSYYPFLLFTQGTASW